jgi:hypothetical protein
VVLRVLDRFALVPTWGIDGAAWPCVGGALG